jgi:hypothetical protein
MKTVPFVRKYLPFPCPVVRSPNETDTRHWRIVLESVEWKRYTLAAAE